MRIRTGSERFCHKGAWSALVSEACRSRFLSHGCEVCLVSRNMQVHDLPRFMSHHCIVCPGSRDLQVYGMICLGLCHAGVWHACPSSGISRMSSKLWPGSGNLLGAPACCEGQNLLKCMNCAVIVSSWTCVMPVLSCKLTAVDLEVSSDVGGQTKQLIWLDFCVLWTCAVLVLSWTCVMLVLSCKWTAVDLEVSSDIGGQTKQLVWLDFCVLWTGQGCGLWSGQGCGQGRSVRAGQGRAGVGRGAQDRAGQGWAGQGRGAVCEHGQGVVF